MGLVEVNRFRYGSAGLENLSYQGSLVAAASRPTGAAMLVPYLAAFSLAAAERMRAVAFDVVHSHWWLPGGLAGRVGRWLAGRSVPRVITLHGSDVHLAGRSPSWRWLARRVADGAEVVAVSQSLSAQASQILGRAVPTLPMPHRSLAELVPQPWPEPVGPTLSLAAVGRLVPEKGFDVLIAAVDRLTRGGFAVHLTIMGSGPEADRLAQAAAQLPAGTVTMRPAGTAQDLAQLLASCDALVIPSRREGLGLVGLDALSLGRPVIASRVGGLPEVVEDGIDGYLVEPESPAALARTIARLPYPTPVGRALARHDPDLVARQHLELYQRLTGRS
jgi:glycosyltransferase involved in cell wall biosynthesis